MFRAFQNTKKSRKYFNLDQYQLTQIRFIMTSSDGEIIAYDESGNPLETSFNWPNAVVLDDSSNYYVADAGFNAVRMIHQSSGLIETIAGTIGLEWGSSPDGTPANEAIIGGVRCLTFDNSGQLFFTEPWTYKVRYIDQDGILYTYAGSGEEGNSGDGGDALNASLGESHGIDFGPDGSLYFASNIQMFSPGKVSRK